MKKQTAGSARKPARRHVLCRGNRRRILASREAIGANKYKAQ